AVVASAGIHLVAVLVPGLQPVFKTFDMSRREWMVLLALSAAIIPLVEVAKAIYRAVRPPPDVPPPSSHGAPASSRSGAAPSGRPAAASGRPAAASQASAPAKSRPPGRDS